jgi:hypothetical protein
MSTYTVYIDAIFSFAMDQMKKGLIRYLIAKMPFLALSTFNPLLAYVVGKLIDKAALEGKIRVFFEYSDLRCGSQARIFSDAALVWHNNKTLENEKAAIDAFKKLGSFVL